MLSFAVLALAFAGVARAGGAPPSNPTFYSVTPEEFGCEIPAGTCFSFNSCDEFGQDPPQRFVPLTNHMDPTNVEMYVGDSLLHGVVMESVDGERHLENQLFFTVDYENSMFKFNQDFNCNGIIDSESNTYKVYVSSASNPACRSPWPETPALTCGACTDERNCELLSAFETGADGHVDFPLVYTPLEFGCDAGSTIDVLTSSYGYFQDQQCNQPQCEHIPASFLTPIIKDICDGKERCDILAADQAAIAVKCEEYVNTHDSATRKCNFVDLIFNGFSSKLKVDYNCLCPSTVSIGNADSTASTSSSSSKSNDVLVATVGVGAAVVGLAAAAAAVVHYFKVRSNPEAETLLH